MTVPFHVPKIDISPYLSGSSTISVDRDRTLVAEQFDLACREVGFVQIVGHGVDSAVIDSLAGAMDQFFDLPEDAKTLERRERGTNRGYTPPKSEALSMSLGIKPSNNMNDFYEAFTVGTESTSFPSLDLPSSTYTSNNWPAQVPGFREAVNRYFMAVTMVSRAVLWACCDALAVDRSYFASMTDYSIDTLKLNNYALPEGDAPVSGELTGMGAHTDFGILTVLWADRVPGLQVLDKDGQWQDVIPDEGALLINLGDAMARWTNDQWRSTVHRVAPPIRNGRVIRRRSAAFFLDGNFDALIEPIPAFVTPGKETYPPITVEENLNAKIAGIRMGKVPAYITREAERVLSAND